MTASTRADLWLWATRFFKTRGLAADKCATGKLTRNGHPVKPSSPIQPGDRLEIPFLEGPGLRSVLVKDVLQKRVCAAEAALCFEDQTLPEVYEANRLWQVAKFEAAKGRPTKRDRREIDKIHGFLD